MLLRKLSRKSPSETVDQKLPPDRLLEGIRIVTNGSTLINDADTKAFIASDIIPNVGDNIHENQKL